MYIYIYIYVYGQPHPTAKPAHSALIIITIAHTVERFIITFKDNLYRRLDSLNAESIVVIFYPFSQFCEIDVSLPSL